MRKPKHKIIGDILPLFVKYFILLDITAVLSLESKYENIVASSQSSTTGRQESTSKQTTQEEYGQWNNNGKAKISTTGHLDWQ